MVPAQMRLEMVRSRIFNGSIQIMTDYTWGDSGRSWLGEHVVQI